ncbi:hypothetical protein [Nocardia stercoris]|uniref:Uncharacterized protein n=1 Tax=Nocardia stercoris TaxID=2483361 RepID=A0A3M2L930_9NOCA|nr:hypothetical protein [Nocardia stercoris]RMI33576.1 hypothetical protein EBN03_10755 [Nocardia stercoris]
MEIEQTDSAATGFDSFRLQVERRPDAYVRELFMVRVYVNEVEMTARGAGAGMDPYDLLVPTNRLIAGQQPHTVPIARCSCGEYGCGATDVTITRDGDVVRWQWSLREAPMDRAAVFVAEDYDREVVRMAADYSWETPGRTAGRLVLTGVDRAHLRAYGLTPSWVSDRRSVFEICLGIGEDYQVFVDIAPCDRSPEEIARAACEILARPPHQWQASWHARRGGPLAEPPAIAGSQWQRLRPGRR